MVKYLADIDKVEFSKSNNKTVYSVCFEPTNKCDGLCPFCLIEQRKNEVPTQTLKEYINILDSYGIKRIGLGGGEPLLRKDIYEIGAHIRKKEMGSLLRTSGTILVDIEKARLSFDWIDISFDSIDKEIFNKMRPGIDYDNVILNINNLINSNLRIRTSLLITAINIKSIRKTIEWLIQIGVRHIRLQKLIPRGRAKLNWENLYIEDEYTEKAIQLGFDIGAKMNIDVSELRSNREKTLFVLKPNGMMFYNTLCNLKKVGHLRSKIEFEALVNTIKERQVDCYVTN